MEKTHQTTQIGDSSIDANDDVIIVTNESVMKSAVDLITKFSSTNKIILKAEGDLIPNAVAIASIITENILKGNTRIADILLDSKIHDEDGMISNIQIVLLKN
jgi:DNA-binding protein